MLNYDKIVRKYQDGAIINLFVTPGSGSVKFPAGFNKWRRCIEMKVRAPPEENKANKEVIKTIADFFDKPVSEIFVISGSKKKAKTVFVKNTSVENVSERLKESFNGLQKIP